MSTPYEDGDPDSKICILGEAPARTEMRMNKPLVGPSGELLEQCMHAAQIIRRECYIVNLFPYEVKKSKDGGTVFTQDGDLWTRRDGLTELGLEEAQTGLTLLRESKANVIITLGATSTEVLTGYNSILKHRGSIYEWEGKKVVPTIHPAASLRGAYLWRYFIINDLDKARKESTHPEFKRTARDYRIDPTYPEVIAYLKSVKQEVKAIGFDIEVMNHQCSCLAIAPTPYEAMCIPFISSGGGHRWREDEEDNIWLAIAEILEDEEITKVGQNIIFDVGFLLSQNNIFTKGVLEDTMVAHHIVWPDFPKGLDFLCSMHTREPYYKDDGKIWKKVTYDITDFWLYNAKDAAVTFEIWNAIQEDLDKGYRDTYRQTVDLFPILLFMMQKGFAVDKEALEKTKIEVAEKIREKEDDLTEISEVPFNPSSPKQCIEYFYGTKSIKPYISRSTGRPTTDDKAMSRIFRRYRLPEAKLVQEIRALRKLHGTYLEVGIDPDDRIRCSYNPRGTVTGRLSSSQTIFGRGMNMQNLHAEFKGFLVADDD